MGMQRVTQHCAMWAIALALISLFSGTAGAQASGSAGRPVGWIDLQLVLRSAPGYAQAESTYAKEMKAAETEIERQQKQFDSTLAAYQQQSVVLSPSAKQAKEGELRTLQQRLQQKAQDLQAKAQERERELIQPIEERIRGIIEGVRAERNIGIIFDAKNPGSGIIAADRTLDLTATVVQRLKAGGQ